MKKVLLFSFVAIFLFSCNQKEKASVASQLPLSDTFRGYDIVSMKNQQHYITDPVWHKGTAIRCGSFGDCDEINFTSDTFVNEANRKNRTFVATYNEFGAINGYELVK
jgi:hypothetical protein